MPFFLSLVQLSGLPRRTAGVCAGSISSSFVRSFSCLALRSVSPRSTSTLLTANRIQHPTHNHQIIPHNEAQLSSIITMPVRYTQSATAFRMKKQKEWKVRAARQPRGLKTHSGCKKRFRFISRWAIVAKHSGKVWDTPHTQYNRIASFCFFHRIAPSLPIPSSHFLPSDPLSNQKRRQNHLSPHTRTHWHHHCHRVYCITLRPVLPLAMLNVSLACACLFLSLLSVPQKLPQECKAFASSPSDEGRTASLGEAFEGDDAILA